MLVTSLPDEVPYPTQGFRELYRLRWGVESFYGRLKTRLGLENFTGNGAEAVRQGCYATLYLTGQAQEPPDAREVRHPQTVNRSVSFNALKNQALDLLLAPSKPPRCSSG